MTSVRCSTKFRNSTTACGRDPSIYGLRPGCHCAVDAGSRTVREYPPLARVEERCDQREHFAGPPGHADVRGPGEHGELRVRQEFEHLHHVGQAVRSRGRRRSAWSAPAVIAARRSNRGTRAPSPTSWPRTRRSAPGRERPRRRRRASPGSRPASACAPRRVARSPGPAGGGHLQRRRSACRLGSGAPSATAYATRPPRLKPKRSASAIPRWSSSATTSPASASIVIGRSVSAV